MPDFENRYFTEDIPCGLCTYKGVAELFGVETPFMDKIIMWAQGYTNKDYIVDGKLNEKLVEEMFVPQRYGLTSVLDLKKAMGVEDVAEGERVFACETVIGNPYSTRPHPLASKHRPAKLRLRGSYNLS